MGKIRKMPLQAISIVVVLSLLTLSCKSLQPIKMDLPKFDKEAHRGGRGLMPENTIPAMINALGLGVTTLEMDIHITQDSKVIVSHDDFINPLITQENGKNISKSEAEKLAFYKLNYSDLNRFDVGSGFYPAFPQQKKIAVKIPLLEDLIDSVQSHLKATGKPQVFYNIETKSSPKGDRVLHPEPELFVSLLMDVIQKKKIEPWVIIQSFDPRTLEILHQKHPNIHTAFLTATNSLSDNLKNLSFKPTIYSPNLKLVTSQLIEDCHKMGMKIIPWTVNDKDEIMRLKSMGVDGIITDYPNLF